MDMTVFFKQMWQKKFTVAVITVFVFLLAVAITLTQPLRYSVTTRLLVVQNYGGNSDAYAIARSNQYLSNVLAQVVYSDAFYDSVMNSGFNISAANFPTNDVERRKFWLNMIDSKAIGDTGMIEVITYHQDKRFADQVNRAVAYILQTKNNDYHGLGDKVRVKVIDNSLTSVWPVKPNLLMNSVFGLLLGFILSAFYIALWPEHEIVIRKKVETKKEIAVPAFQAPQPTPAQLVNQYRQNNNNNQNSPQPRPAAVPQASRAEVAQAAPANLPISEPVAPPANPFLNQEVKKFDGDISNIMK